MKETIRTKGTERGRKMRRRFGRRAVGPAYGKEAGGHTDPYSQRATNFRFRGLLSVLFVDGMEGTESFKWGHNQSKEC